MTIKQFISRQALLLSTVLILFIHPVKLWSQNRMPYAISLKKELIFLGSGGILLSSSIYFNHRISPLSDQDITKLDAGQVNAFDRKACFNWSEKAANRSDIGLIGSPLLAGASMLAIPLSDKQGIYQEKVFKLGLMLLEANLINYSLTENVKALSLRTRPYVYNPVAPYTEKISNDARKSFISGHTSVSALNSFFIARVFSDYFPEKKIKYAVWGACALIPAYTGLQRFKAGKHFPSDIIAAYIIGGGMGVLVPELHKSRFNTKSITSSSLHLFPGGFLFSMQL